MKKLLLIFSLLAFSFSLAPAQGSFTPKSIHKIPVGNGRGGLNAIDTGHPGFFLTSAGNHDPFWSKADSLGLIAVPVIPADGGTGLTTLTNHGVVIGQGTSNVHITAAGTTGQVFTSNGASADPSWQTNSVFKIITTDDTTTSATNVNATGYSFAIGANEKWTVEFFLDDSSDANNVMYGINAPSGALVGGALKISDSHYSIWGIDEQTHRTGAGATIIFASISNSSTPGTVQLRFASYDGGLIYIKKGSYFNARKSQ